MDKQLNPEQKKWIDDATYTKLLRRWRFSDSSDEIFHGEIGKYYSDVMFKKKSWLTQGEQVSASKRVGW